MLRHRGLRLRTSRSQRVHGRGPRQRADCPACIAVRARRHHHCGRRARLGHRRTCSGGRSGTAGAGRRSGRFGVVGPERPPGARPTSALHRVGQRRVRGVDGSAAHQARGRARHRRPARLTVGRSGVSREQPFLVSSFNGGFKWGDFDGGVIAFGNSYRSPVAGEASLIAYDDGSYTVGAWGRDNDPAKQVVALRQNLGMLVDGGAPTPAASNPGDVGRVGRGCRHHAAVWVSTPTAGSSGPADASVRSISPHAHRRGCSPRHAARHQSRLGRFQLVRRRRRQRRARQRPLRRDRCRTAT